MLTYQSPTLPITLVADTLVYSVGAVISHIFSDGYERPIAFASRTLTSAEKNYTQLEQKALAWIFGIISHSYLNTSH